MTVIKLCWNLFEVAQEYKIKVLCTTKSWVLSLESCSYWNLVRIKVSHQDVMRKMCYLLRVTSDSFYFYSLISRLVMSKKEEVQGSFPASSWKRRERLLLEGTGTTQVRFKRFQGYVLLWLSLFCFYYLLRYLKIAVWEYCWMFMTVCVWFWLWVKDRS